MLTNVGNGNRIFVAKLADSGNERARLDFIAVGIVAERVLVADFDGINPPAAEFFSEIGLSGVEFIAQNRQRPFQIAENFVVDANIFVDFGGVNLEVHNLSVGREIRNLAGNSVAETHADANQQVAILNRHVGAVTAVHTGETEPAVAVGLDTAETH